MDSGYIDEIPQNIFKDLQQIGSGSFSDIFSAIHIKTNSKVALKISFKSRNEEEMKTLEQEITINKSLHHPFICKYYTNIETEHLIIIVMELIEGVSALSYVNKTGGLPIQEALNIFTQLVIAMEYLHDEAHITHRDLKLENIMIDKYDHIRLIDFGFSSINTMMTTCCGSIPYCAPEILMGQKYNKEADIWSMGIILYGLIEGNLPFYHPNMNILAQLICKSEVKFTPTFSDDNIRDLIQKMLTKDPSQRITIDEIKNHQLISQQKLMQINYKQLFQCHQENSLNFSSQKLDRNQYALSKSSASFQFDNPLNHYPLLKDTSSANFITSSHYDLLLHNVNNDTDDIDDLISCRRDFASNLNKLIESALWTNFAQRSNQIHSAYTSNLTAHTAPLHANCAKKGGHHCVFRNVASIMQPSVNHHMLIHNNSFEHK